MVDRRDEQLDRLTERTELVLQQFIRVADKIENEYLRKEVFDSYKILVDQMFLNVQTLAQTSTQNLREDFIELVARMTTSHNQVNQKIDDEVGELKKSIGEMRSDKQWWFRTIVSTIITVLITAYLVSTFNLPGK
ncbi:hypothetical protein [Streptomyces sp. CoH17]|uniref:hypothetical protein n=1 Tax=Streptomyces sp. CoH17 TaxID=2992806 RepID=UPI002271E3C6|nr:hypothetical protein [Streptomyces sp. CoH17]